MSRTLLLNKVLQNCQLDLSLLARLKLAHERDGMCVLYRSGKVALSCGPVGLACHLRQSALKAVQSLVLKFNVKVWLRIYLIWKAC